MDKISIRNITVELPSEWNELTRRNLLFLAAKFPYARTHGFELSFFFHALDLWRNHKLSWAIARNFILSKKMNIAWKDDAVMAFGETDFFEQQLIIALDELKNFAWLHEFGPMESCLIKSFSHRLTKYYGPSDLLANVTGEEFSNADDFLLLFLETKEEKYMDYLIACLWREKSRTPKTEDIRIAFSEFEVIKRAQKFARLNPVTKKACVLNYIGLRLYFISRESSKIVFSKSGGGSSSGADKWSTIMLRLAENQTFGTFSEVKKTYIHDIVDHLADLKKRSKE